jgi:hypothetical protein
MVHDGHVQRLSVVRALQGLSLMPALFMAGVFLGVLDLALALLIRAEGCAWVSSRAHIRVSEGLAGAVCERNWRT